MTIECSYSVIEISPGTINVPPKGYGGTERMAFGLARSMSPEVQVVVDFDRHREFHKIQGVNRVVMRNPFKLYKNRGLFVYYWNALTSALILFYFITKNKWNTRSLVLHFHNGLQFAVFWVLEHVFLHSDDFKYVYSLHSPRWMRPNLISAWKKVWAVPTELYALAHADLATFESEAVLNEVVRFLKRLKNYMILPNGVDTDFFNKDAYVQKVEPHGIFYGARMKRQKDQLTVIRAFKDVLRKEPRASLLFVGDPEELDYYRQVRSEVTALGLGGSVRFRSSVDIKALNMIRTQYAINLVYSDYTGFDVAYR